MVLLCACAPVRETPPATAPVSTAPVPAPSQPVSGPLLRVDPQRSLIAVTVRRGGAFARFGHDHVVAVRTLAGQVAPAQQRADLHFRLDQMTVDEAELRTVAGLNTQPDADAIDGTRHNMLFKVLDAGHFPEVRIHAERAAQAGPLQVAITLHGVTRKLEIPAAINEHNGAMTVSGTTRFRQSDFGLVPYSIMAGALAVQDQLELRFTVTAAP
jgi:polyisoprenoid-binding protein YceI